MLWLKIQMCENFNKTQVNLNVTSAMFLCVRFQQASTMIAILDFWYMESSCTCMCSKPLNSANFGTRYLSHKPRPCKHCLSKYSAIGISSKGPSINYVITSEGGGGCEMMMVDDGRGGGGQNMMMSSLFFLKLTNENLSKMANLSDLLYWKINQAYR